MDELLTFYNRELTYIRKLAGEFADAHPRVAGRLKLTADAIDDPHIARLIDSFAYLTARVRLKIEDEFPELTQALFSVLYPNYLAPIPSMAIVQFVADAGLTGGVTVPRGTEIDTEAVNDEFCRYRTCTPVHLLPLAVSNAKLAGRPIVAPSNPRAVNAAGVLRLSLRCTGETPFSELGAGRLRFFLRGQSHESMALYELLHNNVVSVAVADGPSDANAVILGPDAITPVGFGEDEAVLPSDGRSFPGYRLLTEFFCFPDKFLFFDLDVSKLGGKRAFGTNFDVFLYLNTTSRELERSVTADNFALGCAPVVNLFRQRAEPIRLTHEAVEYRVVPNARRVGGLEVHTIERVVATFQDGTEQDYLPFYGLSHRGGETYWHAAREAASARDRGTEMHLTLVDLAMQPSIVPEAVLSVETLCCNRDIPAMLPFGGGRPFLSLVEPVAPIQALICLTPPTPTVRPPLGHDHLWRLISHLSLNHLSLSGGAEATDALREILRLYDFRDSPDTRVLIDSLLSVETAPCSARLADGLRNQFCRGVDVVMEFDDRRWSSSGLFLFASVLEHFLGLYCALNSFTRLAVKVRGRPGVVRKWQPRTGVRRLL